jgi:arsenate reductase
MNKKVLIMCTGNSCRSIIAEAIINSYLDGVEAYSCGVAPSGRVNPNAKRVLENHNIWSNKYYSKDIKEIIDKEFDLVVTVCNHAKETCPVFPKPTPKIHVGFPDPDGKEYSEFEKTYQNIKEVLIPEIKNYFQKGI